MESSEKPEFDHADNHEMQCSEGFFLFLPLSVSEFNSPLKK